MMTESLSISTLKKMSNKSHLIQLTLDGIDKMATVEYARPKRQHKIHKLRPISWCPDCGTRLLYACIFRSSRGTGFCTYTEKAYKKRHICTAPDFREYARSVFGDLNG